MRHSPSVVNRRAQTPSSCRRHCCSSARLRSAPCAGQLRVPARAAATGSRRRRRPYPAATSVSPMSTRECACRRRSAWPARSAARTLWSRCSSARWTGRSSVPSAHWSRRAAAALEPIPSRHTCATRAFTRRRGLHRRTKRAAAREIEGRRGGRMGAEGLRKGGEQCSDGSLAMCSAWRSSSRAPTNAPPSL